MTLKKKINSKELFDKFGIVIILLLLVAIFSIAKPGFFSKAVFINIFKQVSVIGTLAFGAGLVMITGGIDLSPGSMVALVSVVMATYAAPQKSLLLAVIIVILLGAVAGAINGAFISFTKIPPFIATLGMMTILKGFAFIYTGGKPVTDIQDSFLAFGYGTIGDIPYIVLVFLGMGLLSWIILSKTSFGKKIYAIGGNENAAVVCGINVSVVKIIVYSFAGVMSAIGGILLTARVASGNPTAGLSYELDAIASGVIGGVSQDGGVGTIPGVIIGALIMGTLNSGLTQMGVDPNWQQVVKGLIIILAVVLDKFRHSR